MSGSADQRNSGTDDGPAEYKFHVLCPAFHETNGTFQFKDISADRAGRLLRRYMVDPAFQLAWHHHWKSIRQMLGEMADWTFSVNLDRKGSQSFAKMKVGDVGIWIKPNGKPDFKGEVTPADFDFVWIERKS